LKIRQAQDSDLDVMWRICQAVIAVGDALPFSGDFDRETFRAHWFGSPASFVAVA